MSFIFLPCGWGEVGIFGAGSVGVGNGVGIFGGEVLCGRIVVVIFEIFDKF